MIRRDSIVNSNQPWYFDLTGIKNGWKCSRGSMWKYNFWIDTQCSWTLRPKLGRVWSRNFRFSPSGKHGLRMEQSSRWRVYFPRVRWQRSPRNCCSTHYRRLLARRPWWLTGWTRKQSNGVEEIQTFQNTYTLVFNVLWIFYFHTGCHTDWNVLYPCVLRCLSSHISLPRSTEGFHTIENPMVENHFWVHGNHFSSSLVFC